MDPLSITTLAIAVQELGLKVLRAIKDTKNGPPRLHDLQQEILSFLQWLREVVKIIGDSEMQQMLTSKAVDDLNRILQTSSDIFSQLYDLLNKTIVNSSGAKQLSLRFRQEDFAKYRDQIAADTKNMQLFVSISKMVAVRNRRSGAVQGDDEQQLRTETQQLLNELKSVKQSGKRPVHGTEDTSSAHQPVLDDPSSQDGGTQSLVSGEFMQNLNVQEMRFFQKLKFETSHNYAVNLPYQNYSSSQLARLQAADLSTSSDFESWLGTLSSQNSTSLAAFRLIICGKTSAPGALSLSRQSFIDVADHMCLPTGMVELLFSGSAKLIQDTRRQGDEMTGITFRTPLSISEDWTLAISWNNSNHTLNAFIHGLQEVERMDLLSKLDESRNDLRHPLLLPTTLCEMLISSDSNWIRFHAQQLFDIEYRTNTSAFFEQVIAKDENSTMTPEKEFARLTQRLNHITSRLAFHEKRVLASMRLIAQIKAYMSNIRAKLSEDFTSCGTDASTGFSHKKTFLSNLLASSNSLDEQLTRLDEELQFLRLELDCNTKIAQSQLLIVYNLIAQRDNKDNLHMAALSTRIANTTKDDSYAMRTLALMSIIFLPGTFIASFFSMSMFNWQAPSGGNVVSSWFWLYWAITGPLTLAVFFIWLFWYQHHKKREDFPFEDRLTSIAPQFLPKQKTSSSVSLAKRWVEFKEAMSKRRAATDDMSASPSKEEADIGTLNTELRASGVEFEGVPNEGSLISQVQRANTIYQGVRR